MRVLCGQCGHLNELDDGYREPTVACARCGHVITVTGPAATGAAPAAPAPAPAAPPPPAATDNPDEMGFAEQARQSNIPKITVSCPHCGKTVSVSARVAGRKARCKGCDQQITIPYPDDLDDFKLPKRGKGQAAREDGLELVAPQEPPPNELGEELTLQELEADLELMPSLSGEAPAPPEPFIADRPQVDPMAEIAVLSHNRESDQAAAQRGAELAALSQGLGQVAGPGAAGTAAAPPPELTSALGSPGTGAPGTSGPAAPAVPPGELTSVVEKFHGAKMAAEARRPKGKTSRKTKWVLLALVGGLALGVPLIVVIPILRNSDNAGDPNRIGGNGPNKASPIRPGNGGETQTANQGGPVHPAGSQPVSRPSPKLAVPTCQVIASVSEPFAADGYFPAAAASLYWRITARVAAGEEPIRFEAQGKDVRLVFGNERLDSLGVPADGGGGFPRRSRKATISLQAKESRNVTFLFEVPVGLRDGALYVNRAGYVNFSLPAPAPQPPVADLAGTYDEVPPRNLQPILRNPVMAAIQAAAGQQLVVSSSAANLAVAIPAAGVQGQGTQIAPGLFRAALGRGSDVLDAQLRYVGGGRMILYLADQPFHQITYVNASAKADPPPPAPPVAKTPDPIKTAAVADPDKGTLNPKPLPKDPNNKNDPKTKRPPHVKTSIREGGRIFD
jgi:DNA-directed RNA polymerase subunit RPC12/RpoP